MTVRQNTFYRVAKMDCKLIMAVKKMRELTGVSVKDAKHFFESGLPYTLLEEHRVELEKMGITFEPANALKSHFMHTKWIQSQISHHMKELEKLNSKLAEANKLIF